jgi:hypothetical protein
LDTPLSLEKASDLFSIQTVVLKTQLSTAGYFELKKFLLDTLVDNLPPSRQLPPLFENFSREVQKFLLDSMFKTAEQELSTIPKLDIWSPAALPKPAFEVPSFSSAPSPYIARTGEHLLALPQQLEPYADCEVSPFFFFFFICFEVSNLNIIL